MVLDHHESGTKTAGSLCDWKFSSMASVKGELHTPDFVLHNATVCCYSFIAEAPYDTVRLHIVTRHFDQHRQM